MQDRDGNEVTMADAWSDRGPAQPDSSIRCDYPLCPNYGRLHTLADDSADRKAAR